MLQAALSLKKKRYDRVCYMIRSKALKAYKSGTWHIHDLFQNNIDKIKSENYCWYCGKVVESKAELTIDHVIPRAKGGSNEMNNIIMVCKHCNSSKGDRDLLEWFFEVKRCFPPLHVLQHYLKQIYDYAQNADIMSRTLDELDLMELPFNYRYIPIDYPQPEEVS